MKKKGQNNILYAILRVKEEINACLYMHELFLEVDANNW